MKKIRKYVLISYLAPYFKGLAALMLIMIITHFFDFMHVFLGRRPPAGIFFTYFLHRLPEWFVMMMPVATLLAVLFSLGTLNRHHELTAIKTSGIRLQYVFVPIIGFAVIMSLFSVVMHETILPPTTARANEMFREIRGREPRLIDTDRENFVYMGEERRIYSIGFFSGKEIRDLNLIEFFPQTTRERKQIFAKEAVYAGDNIWQLTQAAIREFSPKGDIISYNESESMPIKLPETPENFSKPELHPEQMDFFTLLAYIGKLQRGGFSTRSERVILHNKIAFPFSNTIILFLGIPLALWSGTRNRTTGFFISILICFIYWGAISVGKALGTRGVIHPVLGAWAANIIFLAISLAMLKVARIT